MTTRVIIESPFAGDVPRNIKYAQRALRDSLSRGEAPFAGHLLYTQVLNDGVPDERRQGMDAHFEWMREARLVAVYDDLGVSPGMAKGIKVAMDLGIPVEYRQIGA